MNVMKIMAKPNAPKKICLISCFFSFWSYVNQKYSGEGPCDSPRLTLCVTKNREKTFEYVFEGKRGRLIGWAVKSFQQSLPPLSFAAVHQLDGKKNVKKGMRKMTEWESRIDRWFLCPEFNRIKEQQLCETDRQRGRRPAVAAATLLTITHKHTNTQRITMYHSVD